MVTKWSQVFPLCGNASLDHVPQHPGVYRVRAFDATGKAVLMSRIAGTDHEGILHIGKSVNLKRRLRAFRRIVSRNEENGHHAANEFINWGFVRVFPLERLMFDFALAASERSALDLERHLHVEYRKKYLDRPPLDATAGQDGAGD